VFFLPELNQTTLVVTKAREIAMLSHQIAIATPGHPLEQQKTTLRTTVQAIDKASLWPG